MTEKVLESHNDVFADIVNVLLFNGKRIIGEGELSVDEPHSFYKADGKQHEQERDVSKLWQKENVRLAILGLENQTKVDADMPLRIIGYDGASYRAQLLKEKDGKGNSKVSTDHYAVITLVLYFGYKHHWNQPQNLLGRIHVREELMPYVNDYKTNVFEIAWLTDEQVAMFQSDFRIVADYFVQKRKNNDYVPSLTKFQHVDAILKTMKALTGDRRYEEAAIWAGRRPTNMCEVLDAIEKKGIEQGIERGHVETAINVLRRYLKRGWPLDDQAISEIAEDCNLSEKKVRELAGENGVAISC